MAQIVGERVSKGDAIVDYEDKVFEDIQAEPGEKAYILMHTVPFEGSVAGEHADRDPHQPEGLRHAPRPVRPRFADGRGDAWLPQGGRRGVPGRMATTSNCRPSWTKAATSMPAGSPLLRFTACARST